MVSFEVIQLNVPEGTLKNCGNLTITTLRAVFETGMSLTQVHIVHTGAHVYDINPWNFSVCLSVCLSVVIVLKNTYKIRRTHRLLVYVTQNII